MALPMPRVAPVTSAMSWFSISSSCRGQGGLQRDGIVDRMGFHCLVYTSGEAHQHLAGTELELLLRSFPGELLHRLHPAHRAVELRLERGADLVRRAMAQHIHVLDHRDAGGI